MSLHSPDRTIHGVAGHSSGKFEARLVDLARDVELLKRRPIIGDDGTGIIQLGSIRLVVTPIAGSPSLDVSLQNAATNGPLLRLGRLD